MSKSTGYLYLSLIVMSMCNTKRNETTPFILFRLKNLAVGIALMKNVSYYDSSNTCIEDVLADDKKALGLVYMQCKNIALKEEYIKPGYRNYLSDIAYAP